MIRSMFCRQFAAILVASTLALTACGPGGSPSPSATASTAVPVGASATPAPAATPAPLSMKVWVIATAAGEVVRVSADGGAFHTVMTLPAGAYPLTAGGHSLLATYPDGHLHAINLLTGATTTYGGGTDHIIFGAAFAPDGHRVAYIDAVSPTSATLDILDVSSGTTTIVKSYTNNNYDAPIVWNESAIGATGVIGYADAGPQGVSALNPTDGSRTAHTDTTSNGSVIATDVIHAADAAHAALGDDADASGGPGPQGPFNSLRSITIGAPPVTLLSEAHHNISVLALSPDGSTIVFFDDSAAGGYAGISMSPDFGLFTWSSDHKTQLDHYGTRWDAAAFTGAATFLAAKHSGSTETLVSVSGTTLTTLDSLATADGPASVYLVTG